MVETLRNAPRDGDAAALPSALMTMTMHMVESRIALMGDLARCGTAAEANTVMTKWFERRLAEFGEDQARVAAAVIASFAAATAAATGAIGGLAGAGSSETDRKAH